MSELNSKYKQILSDIEGRITNKEDQEFVKEKISDLSILFIDIIDKLTSLINDRLEKLEDNQVELNSRLLKAQKVLDNIESDIYSDEAYEFEIVCPYCNHEFTADIDAELENEIECPECHNMIELDWNDEEEFCGHECNHCSSNCFQEDDEKYNEDEENEDDM